MCGTQSGAGDEAATGGRPAGTQGSWRGVMRHGCKPETSQHTSAMFRCCSAACADGQCHIGGSRHMRGRRQAPLAEQPKLPPDPAPSQQQQSTMCRPALAFVLLAACVAACAAQEPSDGRRRPWFCHGRDCPPFETVRAWRRRHERRQSLVTRRLPRATFACRRLTRAPTSPSAAMRRARGPSAARLTVRAAAAHAAAPCARALGSGTAGRRGAPSLPSTNLAASPPPNPHFNFTIIFLFAEYMPDGALQARARLLKYIKASTGSTPCAIAVPLSF